MSRYICSVPSKPKAENSLIDRSAVLTAGSYDEAVSTHSLTLKQLMALYRVLFPLAWSSEILNKSPPLRTLTAAFVTLWVRKSALTVGPPKKQIALTCHGAAARHCGRESLQPEEGVDGRGPRTRHSHYRIKSCEHLLRRGISLDPLRTRYL
jgi:hypothetical protein